MLNKSREQVLNSLEDKLSYDLQTIFTSDSSYSYHNAHYVHYTWVNKDGTQVSVPSVPYPGWPPGIEEYIKRVALATAVANADSIYTEKELETKVEKILLDSDKP